MAALNDEIRGLFIDGVNEVFTTLFNDGKSEGVYFYPQIDIVTDVYGEKKNKVYGDPVLLTAKVQLNMTEGTLGFNNVDLEMKMLKGVAQFTIPLKSLQDRGIDVSEKNYFNLRQGIMQYKETFYEIDNIIPTAFVEQVFLLYTFICREIIDLSLYTFLMKDEDETYSLSENTDNSQEKVNGEVADEGSIDAVDTNSDNILEEGGSGE